MFPRLCLRSESVFVIYIYIYMGYGELVITSEAMDTNRSPSDACTPTAGSGDVAVMVAASQCGMPAGAGGRQGMPGDARGRGGMPGDAGDAGRRGGMLGTMGDDWSHSGQPLNPTHTHTHTHTPKYAQTTAHAQLVTTSIVGLIIVINFEACECNRYSSRQATRKCLGTCIFAGIKRHQLKSMCSFWNPN